MSAASIAGRLAIKGGAALLLCSVLLLFPGLYAGALIRAVLLAFVLILGWTLINEIRRLRAVSSLLHRAVERLACGEKWERLYLERDAGFAAISSSLNIAAERLGSEVSRLENASRELEAVLSSMREGVLVINGAGTVLQLNPAAAEMLGLDASDTFGRSVEELLRSPALLRFVRQVMVSETAREEEIIVFDHRERRLLTWGCLMSGGKSGENRILVVLNDVTRMRRLETVRQQFISNVSHELRTPVTAIKGFVETLLDGALDNQQDARRFVDIMKRHADRLGLIIDDLLKLSRMEQEGEGLEVRDTEVKPLLENCIERVRQRAESKNLRMLLDAADDLVASFNPGLLEQAMVNLLENAVNYSSPGGEIRVAAVLSSGELVLSVQDSGCGIEPKHLERVFERFYRVDAGRQRDAGGSGLGLAIVKHIAIAHGGYPAVQSIPGNGSIFSIHLPRGGGIK